MATWLRQSTAREIAMGPFVDSTDGFTAETGLTIAQADVRLKKNEGDWAQKTEATTLVHEENGWYRCLLDTTDTATLGILMVAVNESGALPVWREFLVVPANVWDSYLGADLLQVDAQQWLGGTIATPTVTGVPEVDLTHHLGAASPTPTVAGIPEVDVTHLGGVAQSLLDLKDFADDGYDPATNKVQGVVLADTLTTYTGNTLQTGDSFARIGAPVSTNISVDINNIRTRIPSSLIGGRMDSHVSTITDGVLTAASFAAGAFDAVWAVAARFLTAGTNIVLAKGVGVTGFNDLSAVEVNAEVDTAIADARLDELLVADSDIDGVAPPAVGSVFHELLSKTAGSFTYDQTTDSLEAIRDKEADIEADTQDLQARTPAALVGGRMDSSVGAMAADTLTASALASDAGDELADKVWDEAIVGHLGAGSTGAALNAAGSAGDPWVTPLPGAYGAGTAGKIIGDNINATVSSRATPAQVNTEVDTALADYDGPTSAELVSEINSVQVDIAAIPAAPTAGAVADQVWDEALAGHLGVGSTGEALNAAGAAGDPWTTALPGAYGAGTAGKLVGDNINASISSRLATVGYTAPDNAGIAAIKAKTDQLVFTLANKVDSSIQAAGDFAQGAADKVWATAARTLTAFGFSVTVGTNNDKTGYGLSATAVDDVLDEIVEGTTSVRESLRLGNAANAGKTNGALTASFAIRDLADTKDRIAASTDANGNRTAVTLDVS